MTAATNTPPALLAATAYRLFPDRPLRVAHPLGPRTVAHLHRPGLPLEVACGRLVGASWPAGYLLARSLPLCRSCARLHPGLDLTPTRGDVAAWFASSVLRAAYGDDEQAEGRVQDLISAAITAGVTGVEGCWLGDDGVPWPLHQLFAPYRTQPGGLAERSAAARHLALAVPGAARELRGWSA